MEKISDMFIIENLKRTIKEKGVTETLNIIERITLPILRYKIRSAYYKLID